jgi:hypothetical protein
MNMPAHANLNALPSSIVASGGAELGLVRTEAGLRQGL